MKVRVSVAWFAESPPSGCGHGYSIGEREDCQEASSVAGKEEADPSPKYLRNERYADEQIEPSVISNGQPITDH